MWPGGQRWRRLPGLASVGRVSTHELPPLASPDADPDERGASIEARLVARKGVAPRLDDYRRSYAACGLEWPGDDEVRRRHPVSEPAS